MTKETDVSPIPFFINERHDEVDSWIEIHEHIAHANGKARRFVCEFISQDRELAQITLDALNNRINLSGQCQAEKVTVQQLISENEEYRPFEGYKGDSYIDAMRNVAYALTVIAKKYPNGLIIVEEKP